ncbi:hypothetical protein BH24BAC1_BH24BAC1_30030 [soil metagenome]
MYHFHPQLVLRTPAFSPRALAEADLASLLADPYVHAALSLASRPLYQELEKKGFAVAALDRKTLTSCRKYLNRMGFRPTPFGLFSGFSAAEWGGGAAPPLLLSRKRLKIHGELDFAGKLQLARELLQDELAPCQTYTSNPSLYRVGEEYRYLRSETDPGQASRTFFIDSFACQKLLTDLVARCRTAQRPADIVNYITRHSSASPEEGLAFFTRLVSQQVLVSTLQENITGEDYLARLLRMCHSLAIDTPRVRSVGTWLKRLKGLAEGQDTDAITPALFSSGPSFPGHPEEKPPLYVNLEKEVVAGKLSPEYQQSIREGLHCLSRLLPAPKPPGLQHFLAAFKQKFEQRAVPLLEALDPEAGVGYEDLAASFLVPRLLQNLTFAPAGETSPPLTWTPAHALLLDKVLAAKEKGKSIRLTGKDLEGLPSQEEGGRMPPSLSVVFRITNGEVYLEQAGGVSATALLGRFTPFNQAIHSLAREVARHEQEANPAVVLAEIAHFCHSHTANIDRRETVRGYEIPVLVQSTLPQDRQIPLSDLWVRVVQDRILLWSGRLRKEVVPRLGSAFNYRRNDLSVFRFLCDLQYQGLKANFTLELSSFFPGLSHYPRVTYHSAVLHLASWHLKNERLSSVAEAPACHGAARLQELASTLGWPRHIALTEHDHQLVFDLEKEADRALFCDTVKAKASVVVREFPFADEREALVTDEDRNPYVHQFLAALYHTRQVYPGYSFEAEAREKYFQKRLEKKRKLLPGSEWLYVKLYCHPSRANQLLTENVLPVLSLLQKTGKVKRWFFVRYRDPDYHLRVRLLLPDQGAGDILALLGQRLAKLVRQGTLRDFQVAVYERELERYTPALMEKVEEAFCAGSALVAAHLKDAPSGEADFAFYRHAFSGSALILGAFGLDGPERAGLLHRLYASFYAEFGGTKILRDQLSRTFREIATQGDILPPDAPAGALPPRLKGLITGFTDALRAVAQKAESFPQEQKTGLIADLLHLHLNRLFTDQARQQELVVYYCLWRHYKSGEARAKGKSCV